MEKDRKAIERHSSLTRVAVAWLRKAHSAGGHGCQLALSECWGSWEGEKPDAIGWRSGDLEGTVLVEVKVSRADFLADAKKPHRQAPETGIGRWRYFLCPEGLIQPEELPPGWGLLWVTRRHGVRALAGAAAALTFHSKDRFHEYDRFREALDRYAFDPRNISREMAMLARLLHRIPDLEAANNRIREANNFNQHLLKKLEENRKEIDRLRMRVFELNLRLEAPEGAIPDTHTKATPRASVGTAG